MAKYGANETNELIDGPAYHEARRHVQEILDWDDPRLARVTRLRLISDRNPMIHWDVSYCHGVDRDGREVDVRLPFQQLPKKGMRRAIVEYAKRDHVYARGLGILENISTLM